MAKGQEDRIKREFGARLKSIRKQMGLSQEALALACELDRTYIGGVERGERNISLINIYKIARALSIPPRELME
jgi:transcriptional regulator with XRE-family HTH domain